MQTNFPASPPSLKDRAPYLVIGSGIAGLYTALELSKSGPVILITKSKLSESNTTYAQGGIAAAIGNHDSPELHYQDTIMAGAGLCVSDSVLTLVHEGPNRVKHLIDLGVPFDRSETNQLALTREAAHSRRRILHADGDATGREVTYSLISKVQTANIRIYEDHFALALIKQQGNCCGVITIHNDQYHSFLAAAVILCSGGLGQIYGKTTNPKIATGDGITLAYYAGAVLRDLEFIQFHPTALYLPPAPPFLISESVRGEGAILLNHKGVPFMSKYHPLAELAPRDIVARAIFAEIEKTGNDCVYLDLARIGVPTIKRRFPNIYNECASYGLDITTEPIPVAPAAHYAMGGVATDLFGRTNIPCLYAAGEVSNTGVHGANRLASNSLLEGLVFGGRIADHLQKLSLTIPEPHQEFEICYPKLYTLFESVESDLTKLHQITGHHLGIIRDQGGLSEAYDLLDLEPLANPKFQLKPDYFELQNMYLIAKLIAKSALVRTESRGGHYRSDYSKPKASWRKHIEFCGENMEVKE
ncbi:MAG: L-aspartate oxidase [Firmicutes bacterium]|nr:L-aspartate oxidase [Bacillota bacterium]